MGKPGPVELEMYKEMHADGERLTNGERGNLELIGRTTGRIAKALSTILSQGIMTESDCAIVHARMTNGRGAPKSISIGKLRINGYAMNDIMKAAVLLAFIYTMLLHSGMLPDFMVPDAHKSPRGKPIHLAPLEDEYAATSQPQP